MRPMAQKRILIIISIVLLTIGFCFLWIKLDSNLLNTNKNKQSGLSKIDALAG